VEGARGGKPKLSPKLGSRETKPDTTAPPKKQQNREIRTRKNNPREGAKSDPSL
jgi:hypothetical protein